MAGVNTGNVGCCGGAGAGRGNGDRGGSGEKGIVTGSSNVVWVPTYNLHRY